MKTKGFRIVRYRTLIELCRSCMHNAIRTDVEATWLDVKPASILPQHGLVIADWRPYEGDFALQDPLDNNTSHTPILSDSDEDLQEDLHELPEPPNDSQAQDAASGHKQYAQSFLRSCGMENDAQDVPVLLLPESVAFLILSGDWNDIVLQTSWHKRLVTSTGAVPWKTTPLFNELAWPPADSPVWQKSGLYVSDEPTVCIPDLNEYELERIADRLRKWAPTITAASSDVEQRASDLKDIEDSVQALSGWAAQIAAASGTECSFHYAKPVTNKKWRFSVTTFFQAINVSTALRGGASKLKKVVLDAIKLVAPVSLVGPLARGLQSDDVGAAVVPSEAAIRKQEFSFDAAIALMRRRLCNNSVVRFLWSDSSPLAGHDWLWAQVHEIERSELVSTCRAALELSRLIREYTEHVRSEGEETDFTEPHPSWKQYLQQLLHIHEYIYAPVCLESGFRGLAHKVSGLFHMFHLDCPIDVPLKEYCDTIAGHTSDMGVEMSTPDFKLNDDEGPESYFLNGLIENRSGKMLGTACIQRRTMMRNSLLISTTDSAHHHHRHRLRHQSMLTTLHLRKH